MRTHWGHLGVKNSASTSLHPRKLEWLVRDGAWFPGIQPCEPWVQGEGKRTMVVVRWSDGLISRKSAVCCEDGTVWLHSRVLYCFGHERTLPSIFIVWGPPFINNRHDWSVRLWFSPNLIHGILYKQGFCPFTVVCACTHKVEKHVSSAYPRKSPPDTDCLSTSRSLRQPDPLWAPRLPRISSVPVFKTYSFAPYQQKATTRKPHVTFLL